MIVHGDHYFCSKRQLESYTHLHTRPAIEDFEDRTLKSEELLFERLGQSTRAKAKVLLLLLLLTENGKRWTARSWA